MALFNYVAVSKLGIRQNGTIEAVSDLAAGRLIKEQGLLPLEIKLAEDSFFTRISKNIGTVPLKEKIAFIENLQVMIKSGISAPRALKLIATQTKNPKFKSILTEVSQNVESGKTIHETLAKYPKIFSFIFISMVKVGEVTGSLEKSLEYLGIQLEREADIKSKVKGAMLYPAIIISAMAIIGILMGIFVLPQLTSIFSEFEPDKLPATTKIVIWISDTLSGNSTAIIIGLVLFIIFAIYFFRQTYGKRFLDFIGIHMFIIGPIVKKINLARFSRILSSMLKSGVPIVDGLQVASETVGNSYYQGVIKQASSSVRQGKPLTEVLEANQNLFPFILVQMLLVGEETGSLENILSQLAVQYEGEVDSTMRNLSSVIEPILLLVIGGLVGILALALIAPIYNISQSIG